MTLRMNDLMMPTIHGVPSQAAVFALAELCAREICVVHVAVDDRRANELVSALPFFVPDTEIIYFPAWDVLPYDRVSPNPSIVTERLQALMALLKPAASRRIVVTTVAAFSQMLPPKDILKTHMFALEKGGQVNRDALANWLVQHGYLANSKAVESGEFAIRGSIIDIIPAGMEMGYRLDLFGDEIEQIKQFDPLTQRSEQGVESLTLLPASEVLLTQKHIDLFRSNYRDAFGAISHSDAFYESISSGTRYQGMEHWLPLFYETLDTLADYVGAATLTVDSDVPAALEERREIIAEAYQARVEAARMRSHDVAPYHPLPSNQLYLTDQPQRLFVYDACYQFSAFSPPRQRGGRDAEGIEGGGSHQASNTFPPLDRSAISPPPPAGGAYKVPHLSFATKNPFETLKDIAGSDAYRQKKILITCFSIGSRERLQEMLAKHNLTATRVEKLSTFAKLAPGEYGIAYLPLTGGVETPDALVITEEQLLGERLIRSKRKKRDADYFMAEAANFEEGELVVHKEHGIGRFQLLETITAGGAAHDCLKLVYAGDDRLFVPVENIDTLSRYGSDSDGVDLDRLGASHWQARKAKMKERIGAIAAALMKTAAERALKSGEVMQADLSGYQEFAARFGYIETEDQARAIEQVEQDLLSGKPMDRLVCGDVGFGKTEVAMRAAYIAVSSAPPAGGEGENAQHSRGGCVEAPDANLSNTHPPFDAFGISSPPPAEGTKNQIALIVPTTLLARQHYQNFKARFAGFDIKVGQLSRMVTAKEAKQVKEGLADGSVDIVIGTHALLAKDVKFKHLSLVIVDEEQRFGVTQKEKLKSLKSDVHVLTLTATPIPRTLQLSLAGVRDLSLITTPPVDRLAVRTYVLPFDPVVLREALMREKNRDGGSFIVTPRIQDIGELKSKIKELVPDLHIEVAHGQMPSTDLDEMMNRFYDRKIDVLISTTIIESGLDVPHANTMIINKADRFGLAQLYQLRGRVGRSKTRAYAYLLLPQGKTLTKQATKRLEVMQTLDRLGAGFTLASHDMDIRGFGNLVGDEQSGHIREVGMELYQQMLQDEIEKLRNLSPLRQRGGRDGAAVEGGGRQDATSNTHPPLGSSAASLSPPAGGAQEDDLSPQINLGISVLIPEYYVEDLSLRMGLYRRIGAAGSAEEMESLAAEMIDRFGPLPEEVDSLFTTMRFKWLCKQLRIVKLDAGPKGLVLNFAPLDETRASKLIAFLAARPTTIKMRPDQSLFIKGDYSNDAIKIREVGKVLEAMMAQMVG